MINMNLLEVVTPPSIYQYVSWLRLEVGADCAVKKITLLLDPGGRVYPVCEESFRFDIFFGAVDGLIIVFLKG